MNTRALLPWMVLGVLATMVPSAWADDAAGRMFARQAQQALADGDPDRAVELIEKARIEWPGAPVVAHTLADARFRQGDYASAMLEYDKGSAGALAFRAFFNKGVTLHALAESKLTEAGVPLDPAGIPADVDPGPMIEAIDEGLKTLEYARGQFLDALTDTSDAGPGDAPAARESVGALNKRMDDLREMKEELEQRQQDQEDEQSEDDGEEGEDESEEGEDSEDSEDQEGDDGEQGDQDQEQEQDQDQQDGEGNPEQQEGEQDQPQEPTEPEQTEPVPGQETQLSAQEMAQLLEQLEELEDRARTMQRIRRAQQRQDVERDW